MLCFETWGYRSALSGTGAAAIPRHGPQSQRHPGPKRAVVPPGPNVQPAGPHLSMSHFDYKAKFFCSE